jgi:hypothetical protein
MSRNNRGTMGRFVVLAALVVGGLVVAIGGFKLFDIGMPFSQETKDHSPPLILQEIRDLAEFHAGQAEFEIIIDRENDVKWVPSFIAGDRVQFVAVGTVDASVDFSTMTADSVIYDEDTNSATVILPAPTIGDPVVDMDQSGVMNRDRGVLDRLGGVFSDNPTGEVSLIQEAEDKMAAAVTETDLLARAERNTTTMLENLIKALGVDNVRVVFDGAVPAP